MSIVLQSDHFSMALTLHPCTKDMPYPINATLDVCVESDGFGAGASMDISTHDWAVFMQDIGILQCTPTYHARLEEVYGSMYLQAIGDALGHISITGELSNTNQHGDLQLLSFSGQLDQTHLSHLLKLSINSTP